MLTLNEIRNVNFRKSNFGGYRAEDVEAFIDEVQLSYDTLLRENAELVKKLEVLATKLEDYQNEEDSIRNALMNAQKVGDASLRDAKHKAEIILKDATIKAEKIVSNAQSEIHREREVIELMQRDIAEFKTKLLRAYKDHLTLINNLPNDDIMRPDTREMVDSIQMLDRRAVSQEYDDQPRSKRASRAKQDMPPADQPEERSEGRREFARRERESAVREPDAPAREPVRRDEPPARAFRGEAPADELPAIDDSPLENTPVMPITEKPVARRGGFAVNPGGDQGGQKSHRRSRFSKSYDENIADDEDTARFSDVRIGGVQDDQPPADVPQTSPASLFRRRGSAQ